MPLRVPILPQPDDTTCGPTCLHAIYRFYGDEVPLRQVIGEVVHLAEQGTLAVLLACHALRRGYVATIYTYNLHVFDPSWFHLEDGALPGRLREQRKAKADPKLRFATEAYLEFLSLGGRIRFRELGPELIRGFLESDRPILTGLSATYLYGSPRERGGGQRLIYDDVHGTPTGHFVVLSGYDPVRSEVLVADPLLDPPPAPATVSERALAPLRRAQADPVVPPHYYRVGIQRVLGAILLGVLTYDANFLVLEPSDRLRRERRSAASG